MAEPNNLKAKAHLAGQDSEESRAAVQAQRDLKKKKDALRKLASKLKAATDDEMRDKVKAEIEQHEKDIAQLELIVNGGATPPPSEASPAPAAAVVAVLEAAATVAPANVNGNDSEEARRSVQAPALRMNAAAVSTPAININYPKQSTMQDLLKSIQGKSNNASLSTPADNVVPSFSGSLTNTPLATPGRKSTSDTSALVFKPQQTQLSPTVSLANPQDHQGQLPSYAAMIHPRVAETGLLMQNMQIVGGNARTIAFIDALLVLARTTPVLEVPVVTERERKLFDSVINENFKFLQLCREPCAGMTFVNRTIRERITSLIINAPSGDVTSSALPSAIHSRLRPGAPQFPPNASVPTGTQSEAMEVVSAPITRDTILKEVQALREEIFQSRHTLVVERAQPHITCGDCILTFGRSSSVELVIQHAVADLGRRISVIVVDAAPLYEGKGLATRLQRLGIPVTYGLITSICTLLPDCTKVMIGASSVLQSGEVYSRAGTATVATAAKAFRKPVLCMCESHKFLPKVWIGSLVQNSEVGDIQQRRPMGVQSQNINVHEDPRTKPWAQREVSTSGYLYDLTPASSVDMIVCEMGCLSTSAIAAAIRDRHDRETLLRTQ